MKVINIIPDLNIAGAEVMATTLITSYDRSKIVPICVSFYNQISTLTQLLKDKNIKVYFLNKHRGIDMVMFIKLIFIILKEKPDVIHTHRYSLMYTLIPSIILGVKVKVHTIHSVANKEVPKFGQFIYKLAFKYFDVIPVSLTSRINVSVKELYSIDSQVILNGINLEKYKVKKDYSLNETIKFVHIGRFNDVKNHNLLIDAFNIMQNGFMNMELHLFGDGDLFNSIKEKVNKLNLEKKVYFYGIRDDIPSLLSSFDVFVLTSKWEGLPLTIIEAMSSGLPIIASEVGGIPDIVKNEYNGLLFKSDDIDDLVRKMSFLVINKEYIEVFGKNSYKESRKYDSKQMAHEYEKLYLNKSLSK